MKKAYNVLKSTIAAYFLSSAAIVFAAPQSIELHKGQVVDFLMLTNKENINELRSNYFKDIYPPAKELGYQPVSGFRISKKPISGYYSPDVLAVGSWPGDWQQRQAHFDKLQAARPDIRSRRLDVWSTFNMLNFEVREDIQIVFDPAKSYVFGVYWLKDRGDSISFKKTTLEAIRQSGGKVELLADDNHTMFGYSEPPELILITQWDEESEFEQYNSQLGASENSLINKSSEFFLHIKSD